MLFNEHIIVMYSNDLNHSRYYLTSGQLRKSRRKDSWGANQWFVGERERKDQGLLVLKADLLTNKLKKKHISIDSLEYSRYSNLKSTKCPQFRKTEYFPQDKPQLRYIKHEIETATNQQLQQLQENALFLMDKNKEIEDMFRNHQSEIGGQVQTLQKIVRDIGERSAAYSPPRKEFRLYTGIIQDHRKQKQRISHRKPVSRMKTKSSAHKDTNLLQSFKKLTEEDQALMTLKYSEESVRQNNDTLVQGWQSFSKDHKSKAKKKIETRTSPSLRDFEFVPQQLEDKYYESIREEIVQHIREQKNQLLTYNEDSSNLEEKFEAVLDEIVEKIAYQKVEREDAWRDLSNQADQLVTQIADNLTHLKSQGTRVEDQWHQRIKQLRVQYSSRISLQRDQRKQQQKLMIKTMMELISFLS